MAASVPARGARYAEIVRRTGLPPGRVENGLRGALHDGSLVRLLDGRYAPAIPAPPGDKPAPRRVKRKPGVPQPRAAPLGKAWCSYTGHWAHTFEFTPTKSTRGISTWCKPCKRKQTAERRAKEREGR